MLKKMKLTAKNFKTILLPVIFFFVCSVLPMISFAQAGFEAGGTGGSGGGDVTDAPIDGGVVMLVIAGVAFGVFMLYKAQRNNRLAIGK